MLFLLVACAEPPEPPALGDSVDSVAPTSPWCADPAPAVSYADVGEAWGLADTTDDLPARKEASPIALADLDGDGLDDVLVGRRGVGIHVQLNRGGALDDTLLPLQGDVVGLALGDVDGDGDLDLWAGGYLESMHLFLGDGAGGFVDASESSGIGAMVAAPQKMDGVFGDFDGDGDLDLAISHAAGPGATEDNLDKLLRNDGTGVFEDVSDWLPDRRGLGWSPIWTDVDLDGDLDLYMANADQSMNGPSRLFRNDGGTDDAWVFTDVSDTCGCTNNNNPMGVSSADWNNDGAFDLFLTNTTANQLLQNLGDGTFIDVGASAGGMPMEREGYMTFGAAWFDHDNDGWLDLFVAGGPLHGGNGPPDLEEQPNVLLRGDGTSLVDVAPALGLDDRAAGRGVAVGMLDDDGFLDLAVGNLGAASRIYVAECTADRALVLDLVGRAPNTFGVGARVVVETDDGTLHREVMAKSGWGGAIHPRAHIGLGSRGVLAVTVHWPDGTVQELDVPTEVDGRVTVHQP